MERWPSQVFGEDLAGVGFGIYPDADVPVPCSSGASRPRARPNWTATCTINTLRMWFSNGTQANAPNWTKRCAW